MSLAQVSESDERVYHDTCWNALAMLLIEAGAGIAVWLHGVRLYTGWKSGARLEQILWGRGQ